MIVPIDAEKGILHPCLMRIQAKQETVCNRYLELLIDQSGLVLEQLKIMSNATTIEAIYSQSLKEVWLPIPPIPEQESIIEYIDSETTQIDKLIYKVESAIDRLQEYRTALITAAVTGKIDVRPEAGGVQRRSRTHTDAHGQSRADRGTTRTGTDRRK